MKSNDQVGRASDWIIALIFVGGIAALVAWGTISLANHERSEDAKRLVNRDPRLGIVYTDEYLDSYKYCDGANLIYKSRIKTDWSVAVSPSDIACKP